MQKNLQFGQYFTLKTMIENKPSVEGVNYLGETASGEYMVFKNTDDDKLLIPHHQFPKWAYRSFDTVITTEFI